jgi:hypothetical protein
MVLTELYIDAFLDQWRRDTNSGGVVVKIGEHGQSPSCDIIELLDDNKTVMTALLGKSQQEALAEFESMQSRLKNSGLRNASIESFVKAFQFQVQ